MSSALLVIDMQLVAFDGQVTPPIAGGGALLDRVEALVADCRARAIPVIYLQTKALSGMPYAEDVQGWEIHPQVAPQPKERTLFKVGPSAFENADLNRHLAELGVSRVLVCGIWSEGCIAFTCEDVLKHGYQLTLVADAHGTCREDLADAVTVVKQQNDAFAAKGADVVTVAALADQ